jgi:ankyrin repeat protein
MNLQYGNKNRSILHQLVEDNKLVLFRDLMNLNSQYKDKDGKPILDVNELNHE